MNPGKVLAAVVAFCSCSFAADQTPPSAAPATRPAASQPALPTLARYHNIIKNEFMRDEDLNIVLIPDDLKRTIDQIRAAAADEKRALDEEIAALTYEIKAAEADRKSSLEQAREDSKEARKANRKSVHYTYQTDSLGRVTSFDSHTNIVAVWARDAAKQRAEQRKAQADTHKGNIAAMRADLMSLKKESAALASVASPYNRNLPPKSYWSDLPDDIRSQLKSVGISVDEFKRVLKDVGMAEEAFFRTASAFDKRTDNADELRDELRAVFAQKMPPPIRKPADRKVDQ